MEQNFYSIYSDDFVIPICGFNNTGSICWFNSIMQLLFSLPAFNEAMLESAKAGEFKNNTFATMICNTITEYIKNKTIPRDFLTSFLVNNLKVELDKKKKYSIAINSQEGAANGLIDILEIINSTRVYDAINNNYLRIIFCPQCKHRVSSVDDLSPIINIYKEKDFRDEKDFELFIRYHLSSVDEYKCSNKKCGKISRNFNRLDELVMIRDVIIFTFKTGIKRWYPPALSLLSKDITMLRYKMVAQIEHRGNYDPRTHHSGGHYYSKVYRNGEWYLADDRHIQKLENELTGTGINSYPEPNQYVHIIAYHLMSEDQLTEEEKIKYADAIEEINKKKQLPGKI